MAVLGDDPTPALPFAKGRELDSYVGGFAPEPPGDGGRLYRRAAAPNLREDQVAGANNLTWGLRPRTPRGRRAALPQGGRPKPPGDQVERADNLTWGFAPKTPEDGGTGTREPAGGDG